MRKEKVEVLSPLQQQIPMDRTQKKGQRKRGPLAKSITSSETSNSSPAPNVQWSEERETDLAETIDSDELLDILDIMGMDDVADVVAELPTEECDDEDQEILRYSDAPVVRKATSRLAPKERRMKRVTVETEERPRSRWFITSCRYCGNIYRFRSDQPQPPTCDRPQCILRFEESIRKTEVAGSKIGGGQ